MNYRKGSKMVYKDEKIAQIKKEKKHLKHTDIKGRGVFINDKSVKFTAA